MNQRAADVADADEMHRLRVGIDARDRQGGAAGRDQPAMQAQQQLLAGLAAVLAEYLDGGVCRARRLEAVARTVGQQQRRSGRGVGERPGIAADQFARIQRDRAAAFQPGRRRRRAQHEAGQTDGAVPRLRPDTKLVRLAVKWRPARVPGCRPWNSRPACSARHRPCHGRDPAPALPRRCRRVVEEPVGQDFAAAAVLEQIGCELGDHDGDLIRCALAGRPSLAGKLGHAAAGLRNLARSATVANHLISNAPA